MKIDLPNYLFQKYGLQGFYRRRLGKFTIDESHLKMPLAGIAYPYVDSTISLLSTGGR